MKPRPVPVTDYFGTRLEPRSLASGLRRQGARRFSLVIEDGGILLRLAAQEGAPEASARAGTWLRSVFSPLLPCRVESPAPNLGPEFIDRRRRPLLIVRLTESFASGANPPEAAPGGLSWRRPGGTTGIRPAVIRAASPEPRALAWLSAALSDSAPTEPEDFDVLLDGLEWGVARRPTIAAPASGNSRPSAPRIA